MDLLIDATGQARAIYDESIELSALGRISITRASHVEPDEQGGWHADLGPMSGPSLGPFVSRSQALAAEIEWLKRHWLTA